MSADIDESWPVPEDLCGDGRLAAETLRTFFTEKNITCHGGGGKFYSPQQWQDRGELYGLNSLLVVVHDGGDHAPAFNLDYGDYTLNEQLQQALGQHGMYAEGCTSWYSAIYR